MKVPENVYGLNGAFEKHVDTNMVSKFTQESIMSHLLTQSLC